jgi:hypothetical protein
MLRNEADFIQSQESMGLIEERSPSPTLHHSQVVKSNSVSSKDKKLARADWRNKACKRFFGFA